MDRRFERGRASAMAAKGALAALAINCAGPVLLEPAFAQTAPAAAPINVGASVRDTAGQDVGKITAVHGNFVILQTDRHEVRLPSSSFTPHQGGYIFGMTRDQLNGEVDRTIAAADADLVKGAAVRGIGGSVAGTIEEVDGKFITLKLNSGTRLRLPRAGVSPGPRGAVIGLTAAELQALADRAAAGGPGR